MHCATTELPPLTSSDPLKVGAAPYPRPSTIPCVRGLEELWFQEAAHGRPRGYGCWVSSPPVGTSRPRPAPSASSECPSPRRGPAPRSPAPPGARRGGGRARRGRNARRAAQEASGGTCKGTSLELPPSAQAEPSGASGRAWCQCAAGLSDREATGAPGSGRAGQLARGGGGAGAGLRAPSGRRWPEDCAAGAPDSRGAGGRARGQPAPGARIRRCRAGEGAAPTAACTFPGTSGRP